MAQNTSFSKKRVQTGFAGSSLTAGRSAGSTAYGLVQMLRRGSVSTQGGTVFPVSEI